MTIEADEGFQLDPLSDAPQEAMPAAELEHELRAAVEGDRVLMRRTFSSMVRYRWLHVDGGSPSRVFTNEGSWYRKSGKNAWAPAGKSRLIRVAHGPFPVNDDFNLERALRAAAASEFYSIQGLQKAKVELAHFMEAWDRYSGNNPNKYDASIREARGKVRQIEDYLKRTGVLPLTEHEKIEQELDAAFPNAQSKEVVDHNGKRYMRRFYPLEKSRSGKTITAWGKKWELVES